jgi:hypothetical protein
MPDQNGYPLLGEHWVLRENQQRYHADEPTLPEQVVVTKLQMDLDSGVTCVTGSGGEGGHIGNYPIHEFLANYTFDDQYTSAQVLNMVDHSRPSQWDRLSDTSDDILPGASTATPVGYRGGDVFMMSGSTHIPESTPINEVDDILIHSGMGYENGTPGVIRFVIGANVHGSAVLELQKEKALVWGEVVATGDEAQAVWRAFKRWLATASVNRESARTLDIPVV